MQIDVEINAAVHGGTDWMPSVRRLHLGGKGANGVDSIRFVLPDEWDGLPVNLVVQWKDGTLPTPVLLGADRIVQVNNTFTGSTSGQWMLMATGEDYTAMSKPTAYDCYDVLDASGNDSAEITPSQYEQFVATCLQYFSGANAAMQAAQKSQDAAAASERNAAASEKAAKTSEDKAAASKKAAEESQTAAAKSEANAAENEKATAGYLDQAKAIITGCRGWYASGEALAAAMPTGENGWWAIVGATDTIWVWSSDDGTWKDCYHKVEEATSKRYTIAVPADGWTGVVTERTLPDGETAISTLADLESWLASPTKTATIGNGTTAVTIELGTGSYTIPNGSTLTVMSGSTLSIPDGAQLYVDAYAALVIQEEAELDVSGTLAAVGSADRLAGSGKIVLNGSSIVVPITPDYYTNTVEVEGITADTRLCCIELDDTYKDNSDAVMAFQTWSYLNTAAGALVFYSATKPTVDFAVTALEVR